MAEGKWIIIALCLMCVVANAEENWAVTKPETKEEVLDRQAKEYIMTHPKYQNMRGDICWQRLETVKWLIESGKIK